MRVARKVELFSTFSNVARQVAACDMSIATCNAILFYNEMIRVRLLLAGDFKLAVGEKKSCKQFYEVRSKLRKNIACSATFNVFQSSSLCCKLQEKLPRVTWPKRQLGVVSAADVDSRRCLLFVRLSITQKHIIKGYQISFPTASISQHSYQQTAETARRKTYGVGLE